MRRAAASLLALTCLLLAGCNSVGPRAVRSARFPYNEALIQTWNEQLLLNLVRLRYRDTPYFLQATSLTTQYELSGSASAGATLIEGGDGEASLGTGVFVAETPTVSYVPIQGEKLVKQLMNRIPLDDVMILPQSGWSIERVLRLTVDRLGDIPNAPSTTGPTPSYRPHFESFKDFACHLRRLQIKGKVGLTVDPLEGGGNGDGNETEAAPPTYRYTLVLHESASPPRRVPSDVEECDYAPDLADGPDRDVQEIRRALTQSLSEAHSHASVPERAPPTSTFFLELPPEKGQEDGRPRKVRLTPRSLMGILYFLSQAVEVPRRDLEAGLATPTGAEKEPLGPRAAERLGCTEPPRPAVSLMEESGERAEEETSEEDEGARSPDDWSRQLYDGFFRVHCSRSRPEGAYVRIRYRGHWFYIADHDRSTKSTWNLLSQIVSLQAGGEARGPVHALTLSAGR